MLNTSTITAPLIAFLPILLHILDKFFDRLVSKRFVLDNFINIRSSIEADTRVLLRDIGHNKVLFDTLKIYFSFERDVHFIFVIGLFCLTSLYFAQTECTKSFIVGTVPTFMGILVVAVFLIGFAFSVIRGRIDVGRLNPLRPWFLASYFAFFMVIMIEIYLQNSC
jgi:hypothetical protein